MVVPWGDICILVMARNHTDCIVLPHWITISKAHTTIFHPGHMLLTTGQQNLVHHWTDKIWCINVIFAGNQLIYVRFYILSIFTAITLIGTRLFFNLLVLDNLLAYYSPYRCRLLGHKLWNNGSPISRISCTEIVCRVLELMHGSLTYITRETYASGALTSNIYTTEVP